MLDNFKSNVKLAWLVVYLVFAPRFKEPRPLERRISAMRFSKGSRYCGFLEYLNLVDFTHPARPFRFSMRDTFTFLKF